MKVLSSFRPLALLGLLLIAVISPATDIRSDGVNAMWLGTDTDVAINDGAMLDVNTSTYAYATLYPVRGVAANYKVARGMSTVTTSATITLGTHGLTTVEQVTASLAQDASIDANDVTTTVSGTSIVLKVWKPTSTGNPTPVAATLPKSVSWIAIGT